MQTSLRGITRKAKQERDYRFGNLYGLLDKNALYIAWKEINKKASAGVDKVTAKEFEKNLDQNLNELLEDLKKKTYKARLVKRVNIPKGNGKTRPLGIPTIRDKIIQRAVANILEAIYQSDFLKSSYGYRPGIGPQRAVTELTKEIQGKYSYIVEADIKGYFNNIDHEWLMEMLKLRIKDKTFLKLIKKWLKAGIMETEGKIIHPQTGCPQGGVVSPVLANIYLHYALDLWFEKIVKPRSEGEAYICRFADDFICAFRYKKDAEKFYSALGKRLGKFKLELAEEKTKIISFTRFRKHENTSFEFLGFEYRWKESHKGKDIIVRRTSRDKLRKSIKAFTKWCKENRNNRIKRIVDKLNIKLRGYFNYYGVIGNSKGINEFYNIAIKILYKWLNRRSQRRSFNWDEFKEKMKWYGLIKPRITETSDNQLRFEDCFA
ncbi:group II intron reverse transcriptase/maturase [Natronincola peptidivorans]|uniref:Group II intron reverse transcriptase/maturase n=1 Tax=Natronincola peptidivorans TaxID=426128 RepID=A0A1I0FWJ3_9FIRM|nr:group II intron reverse transcriptase/maturase [Natronincola peptidivorans]SET61843.1 group II intron reverse transcriptase/maturase [Natronincola peptidivorans]